MKVAVSGAGGFLGRRLVEVLRARGWETVALSRRPPPDGSDHLRLELSAAIPAASDFAARRIEGLVHCAWDLRPRGEEATFKINVDGSRRLFDAAVAGGVRRIVNISTMSAYPGCGSIYGRAKLAVEEACAAAGGVSLRPGLIWADRPGGMVGTLDRLVERLPILPLIGSGRDPLYVAHVDDLAALIGLCLERCPELAGRSITAASSEPRSFREVLRARASGRGRAPLLMPVPWRLVWLAVKALSCCASTSGCAATA